MIHLTEEEIHNLTRNQAEEKLLYIRYLLMREHKPDLLRKYKAYSGLLERRIAAINFMEGAGGLPEEKA
jgi:hypothetical protein